jgi:hypothetical protein
VPQAELVHVVLDDFLTNPVRVSKLENLQIERRLAKLDALHVRALAGVDVGQVERFAVKTVVDRDGQAVFKDE